MGRPEVPNNLNVIISAPFGFESCDQLEENLVMPVVSLSSHYVVVC